MNVPGANQDTTPDGATAGTEPSASVRIGPVWECKIGTDAEVALPPGCDAPMRRAVEAAFHAITNRDADFCFSGWGSSLTEPERAVVENRHPSEEHGRQTRLIAESYYALKDQRDAASATLDAWRTQQSDARAMGKVA